MHLFNLAWALVLFLSWFPFSCSFSFLCIFVAQTLPRGPRELSGVVDLISRYKLLPHHDFFCKRPLPLSIADTHYLHNVAGDTEIRKGEGMQLDQLNQNTSYNRDTNFRIQPFDFDILKEAFQLRETTPVELPPTEKGMPTIAGKSKSEKRKHDGDEDRNDINRHKKSKGFGVFCT
ncbi:hypothetical protein GOBAR_AA36447 [Gossypium barbadense]|uniref:Mediator of RNA polymerase II transcription subunit 19 n=1 Tax=Gossypium barbadense TaxID=3634 RepID=A0A2P5VZJ7_GOSBA|nr:hypothetical protein GOBAR_AA36447 [Gossypium barbadense]